VAYWSEWRDLKTRQSWVEARLRPMRSSPVWTQHTQGHDRKSGVLSVEGGRHSGRANRAL
jgi:hypothetical protein